MIGAISNMSTTPLPPESGPASYLKLDALFQTLLECFAIIISGYAAVKFGAVEQTEIRGIKILIMYLLTPCLILQSLLQLQLEHVNWRFLACIFVAKAFVFVAVATVTYLISDDFGKSGLYGIFSTQSNDLALGLPIAEAVFKDSHPDFIQYLYLALPISLMILCPIGFALLEIQRCISSETFPSEAHLIRSVLQGVGSNPLFLATAIGLIGRFVVHYTGYPDALLGILKSFSSAFVTVALFGLGCTLCFSQRQNKQYLAVTPLTLVLAKTLLLPLILKGLCLVLNVGGSPGEKAALGFFGFFYGSIPTAPMVFVYASYYNVAVGQISHGLALGTFLSGPWLYVTSHMSGIRHLPAQQYHRLLHYSRINLGFFTGFLCVCAVIIMAVRKSYRLVPQQFVFCFLMSLSVSGVGCGLLEISRDSGDWWGWMARLLVGWGAAGTCFFAALIPFAIWFLRSISLCFILRWKCFILGMGFGLQAVFSVLNMIHGGVGFFSSDSNFWLQSLVLGLSVIVSVGGLILQQRNAAVSTNFQTDTFVTDIEDVAGQSDENPEGGETDPDSDRFQLISESDGSVNRGSQRLFCSASSKCKQKRKQRCQRAVAVYRQMEMRQAHPDTSFGRYFLLVTVACVAMVLRLFISFWRTAATEAEGSLSVQLQMLDLILLFSQGVLGFLLFAFDEEWLVSWAKRRWRRWRHGTDSLHLPTTEHLDSTSAAVCRQFQTSYKESAEQALCRNIRDGLEVHSSVFYGSTFIDWMLESGVATDRESAVKYGRRLVLGRVLQHVDQLHHFFDSPLLLYRFTDNDSSSSC